MVAVRGAPSQSRDRELERLRVYLQSRGRSPRTIKSYLRGARLFLRSYDGSLDGLTREDLEGHAGALVAAGYSAATVRLWVVSVKVLLAAHGVGTLREFPLPPRSKRLPAFLTEEEVRRLLWASRGEARDHAIVRTLVYSGLRVSELCALRVCDLDPDAATLTVRGGKGGRDRVVVVDADTARVIAGHISANNPGRRAEGESRIFGVGPVTVERLVRRHARDAHIDKRVTPHTLRHTMATGLLENGCDIRFIQKQLGHASLATTEIYTHVSTQSLKTAYLEHLPRFSPGGAQ